MHTNQRQAVEGQTAWELGTGADERENHNLSCFPLSFIDIASAVLRIPRHSGILGEVELGPPFVQLYLGL